jgi:hypothetical protein
VAKKHCILPCFIWNPRTKFVGVLQCNAMSKFATAWAQKTTSAQIFLFWMVTLKKVSKSVQVGK